MCVSDVQFLHPNCLSFYDVLPEDLKAPSSECKYFDIPSSPYKYFNVHPSLSPPSSPPVILSSVSTVSPTWTDARRDCSSMTSRSSAHSKTKPNADHFQQVSFPLVHLPGNNNNNKSHFAMNDNLFHRFAFQLLPRSRRRPWIWPRDATCPSASFLIVTAPRTAPAFPETWNLRTWVL